MVMKSRTKIGRERRREGSQLDELELEGLHVQYSYQLFPSPLFLRKLSDGIGYLQPKLHVKKP
jgi:hypothetical protein